MIDTFYRIDWANPNAGEMAKIYSAWIDLSSVFSVTMVEQQVDIGDKYHLWFDIHFANPRLNDASVRIELKTWASNGRLEKAKAYLDDLQLKLISVLNEYRRQIAPGR